MMLRKLGLTPLDPDDDRHSSMTCSEPDEAEVDMTLFFRKLSETATGISRAAIRRSRSSAD